MMTDNAHINKYCLFFQPGLFDIEEQLRNISTPPATEQKKDNSKLILFKHVKRYLLKVFVLVYFAATSQLIFLQQFFEWSILGSAVEHY